ncbi:unnamed protein product [Prunus brigantina]
MGALQSMIREMMELKARRGERPTYRKPYPAYIDQIPLSPGFKVPNFTLFNREDTHASLIEHIGRFSQKRNSSKGTYYKTPSSSVHLIEVELEEGTESTESSEEREVAVAEIAKLKHPISCKALTKPPKD